MKRKGNRMKLGKLLGLPRGGMLPKMKIMPKASELTGIKKSELGLPSMRPKRKKRKGWGNLFKDV